MNILSKIIEVKKQEVVNLYRSKSIGSFSDSPLFNTETYSMIDEFTKDKNISVISEVKKASPSKGIISPDFNHKAIAALYFQSGTNAVSVLTDETFFMGNLKFLSDIAQFKTKPVLRKDFIIDPIQIFQAKSAGADAILLITEALSKLQIREFTDVASELNMEVLLELHSHEQLDKIDFSRNRLIGINNRNLENFEVNLQTTISLANEFPPDTVVVSESGISSEADFTLLKSSRTNAVLIGEFFMRSGNIARAMLNIKNWGLREN